MANGKIEVDVHVIGADAIAELKQRCAMWEWRYLNQKSVTCLLSDDEIRRMVALQQDAIYPPDLASRIINMDQAE